MREFLFRGKRIDNKEWIEGDLLQTPTKNSCSIMPQVACTINFGVNPETVGQYTGLKDKNWKKIFEGDILKIWKNSNRIGDYFVPPIEYPYNAFVKWDLCSWTWETIGKEKYFISFPEAWCHFYCEVIGNIFDNKELLGGDK